MKYFKCPECDSKKIRSILEGPKVHVLCEHCGFLDEEHHITPSRGGLRITFRLFVKTLSRGHFEDLFEVFQLFFVELMFVFHLFFYDVFSFLGISKHRHLIHATSILIFIFIWSMPGMILFYAGKELVGLFLGLVGLFFGTVFTLRAIGTHL
ncbi:MAG: hypothetical protein ABH851_05850 [Methanobacteriota archaeon]